MDRSEIPAAGGRRFALLTEAAMTPRQRETYQAIVSGPRQGALGPFNALLRSPDVADRVQKVASTSASRARSRLRSTRWPS